MLDTCHLLNSHQVSVPLTFFLAHSVSSISVQSFHMDSLVALLEAGDFAKELCKLQKEIKAIREDLDTVFQPHVTCGRQESPVVDLN